MPFTLNALGHGAAEITGLDCALPPDAGLFQSVNKAFLTYPVLVFRDQSLTAPQFSAFCRRFGSLESYATPGKPRIAALKQTAPRQTPDQMLYVHPEDSDVLIMTNENRTNATPIAVIDDAETWHSDGSHKPEPYKAVAVHVVRNPASGGGETEFCDLRALYDALPAKVQAMLRGRTALHHWSKSKNPRYIGTLAAMARREGDSIAAMIPEQPQPLVRTHPETGRPSLYASPRFTLRIDGLDEATSESILSNLFGLMDDPRFVYRHSWRDRDMMIWDNRCLNHRVRAYDAQDVRCRHRATVAGEAAFFDSGDSA